MRRRPEMLQQLAIQFTKEARLMRLPKCRPLIGGVLLSLALMAPAQTQQRTEAFSIDGYPAEAKVVRAQGRVLIDLEDLARITNGSLRFEGNRIILSLPSDASSSAGNESGTTGFSRPFMRAAIEAMASIREWGGMLMVTVQHGYPVDDGMAGNTIGAWEERAADNVALASAAASNDSDRQGFELLRNEFTGMQAWSEKFVEARRSASAANLTTSENGLNDDADAQKLIRCGRFLAQMFASGTFQDNVACH
jgi:hypothetical protein